ncbi:MAG: hypothetical protein ABIT76_07960 [Chthoniobacterales bacterium]
MKLPLILCVCLLAVWPSQAIDIVTLSGKKYFDVHDVQVRGNQLTFTTDSDIVRVPLADVPPALKARYLPKSTPAPAEVVRPQLDSATPAPVVAANPTGLTPHDLVVNTGNKYLTQMAADLQSTRTSAAATYSAASAFPISQIDDARKDALVNGRAVAFFILDDTLLGVPCVASEANPKGAFAHFFQTFSRSVTPVFVFPTRDLAKLPDVLTIALGKPAAVPAPRVIFTNSDISEMLYDLTLSSPALTVAQRDEAIYPAVGMIKRWYVKIANSVP